MCSNELWPGLVYCVESLLPLTSTDTLLNYLRNVWLSELNNYLHCNIFQWKVKNFEMLLFKLLLYIFQERYSVIIYRQATTEMSEYIIRFSRYKLWDISLALDYSAFYLQEKMALLKRSLLFMSDLTDADYGKLDDELAEEIDGEPLSSPTIMKKSKKPKQRWLYCQSIWNRVFYASFYSLPSWSSGMVKPISRQLRERDRALKSPNLTVDLMICLPNSQNFPL